MWSIMTVSLELNAVWTEYLIRYCYSSWAILKPLHYNLMSIKFKYPTLLMRSPSWGLSSSHGVSRDRVGKPGQRSRPAILKKKKSVDVCGSKSRKMFELQQQIRHTFAAVSLDFFPPPKKKSSLCLSKLQKFVQIVVLKSDAKWYWQCVNLQ